MKYLALDPGGTTGWASFQSDGGLITFGQIKGTEQLYEYLEDLDPSPEVIICEDFSLMPWKAKDLAFNTLETVRVIGAIQHYAWLRGIRIVLQPPSIKAIGYKWAGIAKAKSHANSHEQDAYVHGVYFLQGSGVRKPQQGRLSAVT